MKRKKAAPGLDIQGTVTPSEGDHLLAEARFYWKPQAELGLFLQQGRETAGLSLRAAADQLGISFSNLYKMEKTVRQTPPSLKLLADIAALYSLPYEELLKVAGIEVQLPEGVTRESDYDHEFEALVLHPALKPVEMDRNWCTAFAFLQKQQWVEFAVKLESLVEKQGRCVARIIETGPPADLVASSSKRPGLKEMTMPPRQNRFDYVAMARYPWRFREEGGEYLRELRQNAGLSLRDAASKLQLPFSMLQRWETGGKVRPSLALLRSIAHLYGAHLEDVMREVGYHIDERSDFSGLEDADRAFAALVFHRDLRPVGMDRKWFKSFSELQRQQWIEFAYRLEDHLVQGGPKVKDITARYRRASGGG